MTDFILERDNPITEKVWGRERLIVNDAGYCGKIMEIKAGMMCSRHYHKIKDETLFLISGVVRFELGDDIYIMRPGDAVRVRPGAIHRFSGWEDSVMFETSTTDRVEDNYRLTQSGPME